MEVVLDTNHYTELLAGSKLGFNLLSKLKQTKVSVLIDIVVAAEISNGWLAEINRRPAGPAQVLPYEQFGRSLEGFSKMKILPFNEKAAMIFTELRQQRLKVGTMDLKIAAISLAHNTLLLTRNLVDFEKVPDLRVENWLD